ncbi:transposase [Patescibacteria group bacterium]|nr:transposase [Patescibacteria group bacterium]
MFKPFHPPHIYLDNTIYFITARTRDKWKYFNTDRRKLLINNILKSVIKQYDLQLYAWVILANHYHLLIKIKSNNQLIRFIKSFHGQSAISLNKIDKIPGRKIWVNYWDHCIRDEKDFWRHFNYIHHNPVKHKCVTLINDYKFSSYREYLEKNGEEWLGSCFRLYPIIDFTPQDL